MTRSGPCFYSSIQREQILAEDYQHSNIGLLTDFYQKTARKHGEIKVKWPGLAQLGTKWRAINVYLR